MYVHVELTRYSCLDDADTAACHLLPPQATIDRRMAEIDAEVEESRARFRARVMAVLCEDLDDEDELKLSAQRAYAAYVDAEQAANDRLVAQPQTRSAHQPTRKPYRSDDAAQGDGERGAADEASLEAAPDRAVDERAAAVAGWLALAPKVDGRSVPDTQIVERDFNWR